MDREKNKPLLHPTIFLKYTLIPFAVSSSPFLSRHLTRSFWLATTQRHLGLHRNSLYFPPWYISYPELSKVLFTSQKPNQTQKLSGNSLFTSWSISQSFEDIPPPQPFLKAHVIKPRWKEAWCGKVWRTERTQIQACLCKTREGRVCLPDQCS